MKKILISIIMLSSVLFIGDICLAKEFVQRDGVFKINLPDGWDVKHVNKYSMAEEFYISNPGEGSAISIMSFMRKSGTKKVMLPKGVAEKDLSDYYFQKDIAWVHSKATITLQKKILLDGLPAYRIDYIRESKGKREYGSLGRCITKNYIYRVAFRSSDKDGILGCEKILNTIKINKP